MFEDLGPMPFPSPSPFEEPLEFAQIRACEGLPRIPTSTGDVGWLATRYADVKALGADQRIGKSHSDPSHAPRLWDAEIFAPQTTPAAEMRRHRFQRRVIAGGFGPNRVEAIRHSANAILDRILNDLATAGPPVDLCAALAVPFAVEMVLGHVGIPEEDWQRFLKRSSRLRVSLTREAARADQVALKAYMLEMLERKRRTPGSDIISELAQTDNWEAVDALTQFCVCDFETVAARIGYAILFLLAHPKQRSCLERDRSLVPSAVEEILRLAVPGGSWLPRYALADIEYGTARIRAGDLVVLAIQSANRDERQFPDPGSFVIDRTPNPHIGFGHGKFYCLGSHLSRVMLQVILSTIFERFPRLRLDVPVEKIGIDRAKVTGGLLALPVAWD